LNNALWTHPLTIGVHHSKHAHVPKTDILNTRGKLKSADNREKMTSLINTFCKLTSLHHSVPN